jgi:hypothetical protein
MFAAALGLPLVVAAMALVPGDWLSGESQAPSAVSGPEPDPLATDWIGPFVARLQPVEQAGPSVQADTDPLEGWRLVGLVEGDDGVWITLTGRGEVMTLSLGEEISGYALVGIENNAALFRRGEDERSLRLPR